MAMSQQSRLALMVTASVLCTSVAMEAHAQSAPTEASRGNKIEEVVVTARKRSERLISVPVVMVAVGKNTLKQRAINTLDRIAQIVPQLIVGPQGGSVQGGEIAIRGISGPDSNPFGDQAVSFNVDGVQIAKSTVRRMAEDDLDDVEVLKGPQALFYGKNSPAGIVSIKTADPTDHFEAGITTGYEFYADESRTSAYVSGPITDTLTGRVSGYFSSMQGYLIEQTPSNSVLANQDGHNPDSQDYSVRTTLKWQPSDDFTAKLKLSYAQTDNNGPANATEFNSCPNGVRGTGSVEAQCTVGDYNVNAGSGPVVGTIPGTQNLFGDGQNFQHQQQFLGGLQMDWSINDNFRLSSVTGYYYVNLDQCQNYENDYTIALPSCNTLIDNELSQEIRIASTFSGPLNFYAGLYYSNTSAGTGSLTYLFSPVFDLLGPNFGGLHTPAIVDDYYVQQTGQSYSGYAQVAYKPLDVIEIDVGGRYSYEQKQITSLRDGGGLSEGIIPGTTNLSSSTFLTPTPDKVSFPDFSPEVTVSYRPSHDLTFYGSYKHGFLSGGFNSSSVNFRAEPDISYQPEIVKGGELGAKAALLGGSLRLDADAYYYTITGLQVTEFTNATSTIRNAGSARTKGVEGDFAYLPPVLDGLNIHGSAAYNDGIYTSFPGAPCYNGETPTEGCHIAQGNPIQNLSKSQLPRAPLWNLSGGFTYETPIGGNLKLGFESDVNYSSSYRTDATSAPASREPDYVLFDSSIRLGALNDKWVVSVIGNNLTNTHYFVADPDVPFTGSGTGTAAGKLGDRFATVSRGREVMLQASYKFF